MSIEASSDYLQILCGTCLMNCRAGNGISRSAEWVRNGDEITSATMHHSFRPPLPDLKSQKYQNSLLFLQLL
nr:hypothetical protein GZ18F2_53 [uncultured archaeon GZfos18F2]